MPSTWKGITKMNGSDILRTAFGFAHQVLESVIKDVDAETLHATIPGATIGSPASTYAHAVFDEDIFIQRSAQGKEPVYVSGRWGDKVGVAMPATPLQTPEWDAAVRINDVAAFRAYAKAVYAATDAYVAGLSDTDLDRLVDAGQIGKMPLGEYIVRFSLWHLTSHQGEISAVLGAMGKKGLRF